MNPIFKPTALSWEDIEGGLGEVIEEEICNFMWEYCCSDDEGNPRSWDSDEELPADLAFFAEAWEKIDGNRDEIATPEQTAAVLSLIDGSFYGSWARDKIVEALVKSATKPRLVEIVTHVAREITVDEKKLEDLIRRIVREVLDERDPVYKDLEDVPKCWREQAAALLDAGVVNGGTPAEVCATDLNLHKETLRAVVVATMYHDAREAKR